MPQDFEAQRLEAEDEMRAFVDERLADPNHHPMTRTYYEALLTGGPDIWHGAVTGWNTDEGYVPLQWVMRQPQCDVATARFLFHYLDVAGFSPQFGKSSDPAITIAEELWQRVRAGFYTRSEIAFAPRPMSPLSIEQVNALAPEMMKPIAGRPVRAFDMDMGPHGEFWPGHKPW